MRPTSLVRTSIGHLALPRSVPVSSTHLTALYEEQLRVAHQFDSYNFRHFFLRKTHHKFRVELPAVLAESDSFPQPPVAVKIGSNATPSELADEVKEEGSIYKPTGDIAARVEQLGGTVEQRLRSWYDETVQELAVMKRAATVNQMYQGPRLVVEPGKAQHKVIETEERN